MTARSRETSRLGANLRSMKASFNFLISCCLVTFAVSCNAVATPAFPGAEGWGRNARGGRDPAAKILFVTSLEDSGPGTLREALKTKGPRFVLFKTGGIITLTNKLTVQEGRLTIAGQTAPGDGVSRP